jgi:hypothetical protein
MAFLGHLIKINGTIFSLIKAETYQITPNQIQDDNTYVDGDGVLHRDTLPHKRTKIEFTTPHLSEADNRTLQALIPNTVTVIVEYWNPRKGTYETATCYTPDLTFEIFKITGAEILYSPIRMAFIEY